MDQQSAPLPVIIIMDVLASEIDKERHWVTLFAYDPVMCETFQVAVERERERGGVGEGKRERELDRWRDQFENHGLRSSRSKTAYKDYDNKSRNSE